MAGWLLGPGPACCVSGELQGRICLVFYLPSADAAQTLPKEQSVAKPSPDQLQVNPTARGFFYCTEPPLLCTSAWWTARTFLFFFAAPHLPERKNPPHHKKKYIFLKSSWESTEQGQSHPSLFSSDRVPVSERVFLGCSTSRPQLIQLCFPAFFIFPSTFLPVGIAR